MTPSATRGTRRDARARALPMPSTPTNETDSSPEVGCQGRRDALWDREGCASDEGRGVPAAQSYLRVVRC